MKLLFLIMFIVFPLLAQNVKISPELINRFKKTKLVNSKEIVSELNLQRGKKFSSDLFEMANPYYPITTIYDNEANLPSAINGQTGYRINKDESISFYHQEVVYKWFNQRSKFDRESEVCGLKFVDDTNIEYRLKTFPTSESAASDGYVVTHQFHCGGCSSLHDLAIYLESRDLVTNGRKCALKKGLNSSKKCHINLMGLSPVCSEVWAYSAMATKKRCKKICLKEYGLIKALLRKFPKERVNEDGTLKPCILCDELRSGGAFRFSAGRSRRSSGITSSIQREENEIYPIDYRLYYEKFNLTYE
ncbi:hypothetical protein N9N67_05780 [Bacteriovoracaceae bacterium]|nr:hypothetical protein [Bacteriovoracaceae bacterium]